MKPKDNIIKGQLFTDQAETVTFEVIDVWLSAGQISKVCSKLHGHDGRVHERTGEEFYEAIRTKKILLK